MQQPAADAADAAVAVERHRHRPVLVALLDGGEEMLAPILDPFERAAEAAAPPPPPRLPRDRRSIWGRSRRRHRASRRAAGSRRGRAPSAIAWNSSCASCVEDQTPSARSAGAPLDGDAAALDGMAAAAVLEELAARRPSPRRRKAASMSPKATVKRASTLDAVSSRARGASACDRRAAIGDRRQPLVIDRDERRRVLGDGSGCARRRAPPPRRRRPPRARRG